MSVAKIIEISSSSATSFQDAIEAGIAQANRSTRNITGAWVQDQKVVVEGGKIVSYRVNMKLSFVLDGQSASA